MAQRIGRKVYAYKFKPDGSPARVMIYCPACECPHWFPLDGTYENPPGNVQNWTFNGDGNAPTFTPSMHINAGLAANAPGRCHTNITAGKIQFHGDCAKMAGQTVDLPDWPTDEEWDDNGP